ncbi:MAG: acetylglutamate kinase [Planctomycetes bacterium]|nr:acetylglutamate kinase [Planctomycetota bacterium]
MQDAINKAAALIEAHEYIRRFEGKTVVIKVGGSIMDDPATLSSLIHDVCFMDAVGMHPVVVHGGGKSINEAMKKAGLDAQFVQGRRYTDERTLAIAEHVLVNEVNKAITDEITRLEHKAMPLHSLGSCVVFGKRLFLDGQGEAKGRKIDIGMVGEVESVNAAMVKALLEAEFIPVIAPIARDAAGGKLNINADTVAGFVAAAIKAEKLILVSDTPGIRTSADADSYASHLTRAQIDDLSKAGVIDGGMLPKVEAAIRALEAGVGKVHVIDGRIPHSAMLEIYTRQGIGTELVL